MGVAVAWAVLMVLAGGCGQGTTTPAEVTELNRLPVDTLTGILTQSGVAFDPQESVDGNGSVVVSANGPTTVRLYELGDLDVEDARLIYQAKVRTEDVRGKVYLEMWCHFPGKGEFFSRGLTTAASGTTGWTSQETPFFLKKGENPDNVKLNLVVEGAGKAWIDDIRIVRAPL